MNKTIVPKLYKGEIFIDDRGIIGFNNELDLSDIKRFYTISNHVPGFIRAWHGHINEAKYFIMLSGSSIIVAIKMIQKNNIWEMCYEQKHVQALSAKLPSVFYIPPKYANGFKLLTSDATLMVFSTNTIEESKQDDIRFPYSTDYNPFVVIQR